MTSALHVWPGRAEEDDPLVLLALLSLPPAAAAGGRLGSAAAELNLLGCKMLMRLMFEHSMVKRVSVQELITN